MFVVIRMEVFIFCMMLGILSRSYQQVQAFRCASRQLLPTTLLRNTSSSNRHHTDGSVRPSTITRLSSSTVDRPNSGSRKRPRADLRFKKSSGERKNEMPVVPLIVLEPSITGLPRVLLKRNRQSRSFRDGSQLVFSGSVAQTMPLSISTGDLVQVEVPVDSGESSSGSNNCKVETQLVGWGVYNPDSMYRVRILCHSSMRPELKKEFSTLHISDDDILSSSEDGLDGNQQKKILKRILTMNFQRSLHTRRALGLPSDSTDTYRLVNGEGDSLSGMAIDVVGNKVAVIMSSAAWCEIHRDTILECLERILPNHELVWKTTPSRLKQDGYEIENDADHVMNDSDADSEAVICVENGVKFRSFPHQRGQKTSVYCDQRENRWNLAQLCSGKQVLDLCCYHGGFSLNAAKQGAKVVVGVDSSEDAIETCKYNAALNLFVGSTSPDIQFVKSDVADFMRSCEDKFDVIVLDPPKLAPSISDLSKASRKYHSLNRDALKLIDDDGGIFMTCTCSAAMTQKDGGQFFLQMVQQASLAAKREVTLLRVSGAAACHVQSPVSFPAGNYLTAALFMVHPKKA